MSQIWLFMSAAIGGFGATLIVLPVRWGRRRRDAPILIPLDPDLFLVGRSAAAEVGLFRGQALAARLVSGLEGESAAARTRYLVDDLGKAAPVWVSGSEVERTISRVSRGDAVLGYVTVAPDAAPPETDEPRYVIERACAKSGWDLVEIVTDHERRASSLEGPGLIFALRQISGGEASGLVIADLRQVLPSVADLCVLVRWFVDAGAALIVLDLGVDTSTPHGYEVAEKLILIDSWARDRTARGTPVGAVEAMEGFPTSSTAGFSTRWRRATPSGLSRR
jgi:Resolvase, N terminal domain